MKIQFSMRKTTQNLITHTHKAENYKITSVHPYSQMAFHQYQECTPRFFFIFFLKFVFIEILIMKILKIQ